MNRSTRHLALIALAALVGLAAAGTRRTALAEDKKAMSEKEKALANPYPNDLGPNEIDASGYPADAQEGYKLLKARCAQCHQPARPLNSRFYEPDGKDEASRKAAIEKMKKEHPEYFADGAVLQIEWDIWQRYVKRMMSKPGCKVDKAEGQKIWKFLVFDGNKRKVGANFEKWKAHRKKLVEEFKTKYPKRYEELSGSKPVDL
ncbi:MAG: hypothetical protein HY078_01425 [Elusimicrobia bacterium]|nr:hypothetical protein [Elusimicrobiota bacterium]